MAASGVRWLVLVHAIPPKPNYLRVKTGRRLQKLGAVAIKNSVYALPCSEDAREDFAWVAKQIVREGGDASVMEGSFVEGLSDGEVKELVIAARDADYREVSRTLKALGTRARPLDDAKRAAFKAQLDRYRKRVEEISRIDFFGASGREAVEGLLKALEDKLRVADEPKRSNLQPRPTPRAATWVTRTGIHVDRMASAWLIRRFIDPKARFRFVSAREYVRRRGELRFDMFEGEFTHEGDACSFEVLLRRFQLEGDPALQQISQLVHDVDLKDHKFGRPDTPGFERLIAAIATAHRQDATRLERASAVLDDLYFYFGRGRRVNAT
jgi:hypothetical protein